MSNPATDLPAFPEPLEVDADFDDICRRDDALVAFWESRARLAVDRLTTLLPHVKHTDECAFGSNCPDCFCGALPAWRAAKDALAAIGPLPSQERTP